METHELDTRQSLDLGQVLLEQLDRFAASASLGCCRFESKESTLCPVVQVLSVAATGRPTLASDPRFLGQAENAKESGLLFRFGCFNHQIFIEFDFDQIVRFQTLSLEPDFGHDYSCRSLWPSRGSTRNLSVSLWMFGFLFTIACPLKSKERQPNRNSRHVFGSRDVISFLKQNFPQC